MRVLGIIPSKYENTRFPGKGLADLCGKSVLYRVWESARCAAALDHVVVATPDMRTSDHVHAFYGQAIVALTALGHRNGTECCREAADLYALADNDVVINIQGDEPFIQPSQINRLVGRFRDPTVEIATLVTPVQTSEELWSENTAKVILDLPDQQKILYFSRWPIPYCIGLPHEKWLNAYANLIYYRHIGVYGYRMGTLRKIVALSPNPLSRAESLEQLRWLQHGYPIHAVMTENHGVAIDSPEDLEKAREKWNST